MGFPSWTLWGMGLAAAGALIWTLLAYIAQSPWLLMRFKRLGGRVAGRGRVLTGYALASLLLALGFFLAGVPLGRPENVPAGATDLSPAEVVSGATTAEAADEAGTAGTGLGETATPEVTDVPESGAFIRQPAEEPTAIVPPTATATPAGIGVPDAASTAESTRTLRPTGTPEPTATPTVTPSPTISPTPTITPSPTITPTPISGPTVRVSTSSSTLWIRRTPGGEQLELLFSGDLLLLENGRANQGGVLWQKVRTVDGTLGWAQEDFLEFDESSN